MLYGDPGSVIPLNIPPVGGDVQLSVQPGLVVARRVSRPFFQPVGALWSFAAGVTVTMSRGDAIAAPVPLRLIGTGNVAGGMIGLSRSSFLHGAPLGVDFGTLADPERTQTPHRMRCSFKGIVPKADGALLFYMIGWGIGSIALTTRYGSDQLECVIGRGDRSEGGFFSTTLRKPGIEQLLEVEWRDMPGQPGGTISFFIDGKPAGGPFRTRIKPRITPEMDFSVNAALGNTRQAVEGLKVRELRIGFDKAALDYSYVPVSSSTPVR